jgi:ribosome maturation factor RimP
MTFSFTKLAGIPAERLLAVVEPVLAAHGLEGVELIWKTDNRGWVLYLTVERPGTTQTGAGVTLDDCSELSRDISAALDVDEIIPNAYRLEVGTPGVERRLYGTADFARFAGQTIKVKLQKPLNGEYTLRGKLLGVNEAGQVSIEKPAPAKPAAASETVETQWVLEQENIQSANLVLEWGPEPRPTSKKPSGPKKPKPASDADKNR